MRRSESFVLAALVGALVLCWVLLTPPGAGADEPSHFVRAGALANGDLDELLATDLAGEFEVYQLPGEYSIPEPGCFAQNPATPVDCAVGSDAARTVAPDGTVTLLSTAGNYPVWGHVAPAIGSALPGDGGIWAARIASAVLSVGLVAGALAVARRWPFGPAGVLVALTPMAWSTFAVVNPSAPATAGAVAVWVALAARQPGWLLAAGWAALVLPRRDGLTWACLIVAAVVLVCGREVLADVWRERRRLAGPLALIGASTLMTLVWDVTNGSRIAQLGALAPGAILGAWALRWLWDRAAGRPAHRAALVTLSTLAAAAAVGASFVARPGGWNGAVTRAVIGETRRHLTEAIGVLGWLDAPLPRWSVVGWVVLVAALVAVAISARAWPTLLLGGGALVLAVVTSWVFELQEGSSYGRYWQGRYSLPLLVGLPIVLGVRQAGREIDRRAAVAIAGVALLLVNVAAWAAARRWAVGIHGTHRPWKWGAELIPVHPLLLLTAHAAASVALVLTLTRRPTT